MRRNNAIVDFDFGMTDDNRADPGTVVPPVQVEGKPILIASAHQALDGCARGSTLRVRICRESVPRLIAPRRGA